MNWIKGKAVIGVGLLLLAGVASVNPAAAYYPWYLYLGQSLLYPLTRSVGFGNMLYGPYPSNPFYSTSSYLKRTAGMAAQWPYVYGGGVYGSGAYGPYGYRNAGLPLGYGSNSAVGNYVQDQIAYQRVAGPPVSAYGVNPPIHLPAAVNNAVYPPANFLQPTPIVDFSLPPRTATAAMPPLAPAMNAANALPSAYSMDASAYVLGGAGGVAPGASLPLADGFVNNIVTKHNGNMKAALGDPATANWAKALGIIEDDKGDFGYLSDERLDIISKVLRDSALDSGAKLDTLKILLRRSGSK